MGGEGSRRTHPEDPQQKPDPQRVRRMNMKLLRFMLSAVVLISLSIVTFAKVDGQKSEAQKSFDNLKSLAGSWEGHVTTVPQEAEIEGKLMQVTLRVTSMGNALVHEMT